MAKLDAVISKEFDSAPKTQSGAITRRNVIKVLQNVFKQDNGTFKTSHSEIGGDIYAGSHNYAYAAGFGYGYGGFLSQTKDLFELYIDKDSEGGEILTTNEQKEIINTVKSWFKNLKNTKIDSLIRGPRK